MSILKGLGGIANGWMKFGVAIAAALWLGGQALDRVLPIKVVETQSSPLDSRGEMLVSTHSATNNSGGDSDKIEDESNLDSNVVPASATRLVSAPKSLSTVEEIGSEMSSGIRAIVVSPIAHAVVTGIVGLLAGFFGRPSVDWLTKRRRIALARQRLSRLEEDRQLLAESGIPSQSAPLAIHNVTKASTQLPGPQV
jgi:hypothetical protein